MDHGDYSEMANWAADCAERALPSFETRHRVDERPRKAVAAARAWARGELKADAARELARDAERAARESQHPAAIAAARACAEAAYISRGVSHALSAAAYARVVVASENPGVSLGAVQDELERQRASIPTRLAHLISENQDAS